MDRTKTDFNPDYICQDGSEAMLNVANEVFGNAPDATVLMCYFHVMQNVTETEDNETEFKYLFHEFSKKWNKKATKAFYEYFRTQWVKRNTDNLNSNSRFWR
jgi:hypothetical protein